MVSNQNGSHALARQSHQPEVYSPSLAVSDLPADMPIKRPSEDVFQIALASIEPPTLNYRRDFPEEEIASLAESIRSEGLLQPVILRPRGRRFELVAGERRLRAVTRLGRKTIEAKVRELDDRQAAEIRLLENLDRKSLNAMEEASAFRVLQDLGHSVESLAKLIRISEGEIHNRAALTLLPDDWQARIRKGQVGAAHAEYLVPWVDRPTILDAMVPHCEMLPMPLAEWGRRVADAVIALSRSTEPKKPDGPRFDMEQQAPRLDVVTVRQGNTKVQRAMNVGLWDELQDRADGLSHADEPAVLPAAASPMPDGQAHQGNGHAGSPLHGPDRKNGKAPEARVRLATGPRLGDPVLLDAKAVEANFRRRTEEFVTNWYRQALCQCVSAMPLPALHALADWLNDDFDPASAWKLTRPFLELFAGGRLEDLAKELGVDVAHCCDDRERIAVLLAARTTGLPSVFAEARAASAAR